AALAFTHQLVDRACSGSRCGEALVNAAHGQAWTAAVVSSLLLTVVLAVVGLARLARLGLEVRRARTDHQAHRGALAPISLLRAWLRLAPRIAVLQLLLLPAPENTERRANRA